MFGILTLLSIPMLVLTAAGNRVEKEFYSDDTSEKDSTWFMAILTVGNLGTDRLSSSEYRDQCLTEDANVGQCGVSNLTIAGADIPMTTVAQVFQFLDLAMVIVYCVYCVYFARSVRKIRADTDQRQLTVGDYAISVEGIPPETQREDIRGDATSRDRNLPLPDTNENMNG